MRKTNFCIASRHVVVKTGLPEHNCCATACASGERACMSRAEREALEREYRELRQAEEISCDASMCLARGVRSSMEAMAAAIDEHCDVRGVVPICKVPPIIRRCARVSGVPDGCNAKPSAYEHRACAERESAGLRHAQAEAAASARIDHGLRSLTRSDFHQAACGIPAAIQSSSLPARDPQERRDSRHSRPSQMHATRL
jgi:hypothetical protein